MNGRNQESSSEAVNAYYGVALYGHVMAQVNEDNILTPFFSDSGQYSFWGSPSNRPTDVCCWRSIMVPNVLQELQVRVLLLCSRRSSYVLAAVRLFARQTKVGFCWKTLGSGWWNPSPNSGLLLGRGRCRGEVGLVCCCMRVGSILQERGTPAHGRVVHTNNEVPMRKSNPNPNPKMTVVPWGR